MRVTSISAESPPLQQAQLRYCAAWIMHLGRCARQQDAIGINGEVWQFRNLTPKSAMLPDGTIFVIADGVACSPSAGSASRWVAATVGGQFRDSSTQGCSLGPRHVRAAQAGLCDAMRAGSMKRGASTTVVACQLAAGVARIVNSGDSRAWVMTADRGLRQLSQDHTERERLRTEGLGMDGEYASIYNALSDCLIADPEAMDFEIAMCEHRMTSGERLLLCSDGVHDVLSARQIAEAFSPRRNCEEIAQLLRAAVLNKGAPDNFSLIVIEDSSVHD